MKWLLSRLANAVLLFALLVLAIGAARLLWPDGTGVMADWQQEIAGPAEVRQQVESDLLEARERLEQAAQSARTASLTQIDQRMDERLEERARLEQELAREDGVFAAMLPSRILARKRAEIALAVTRREIALLEAARGPRASLEALQAEASIVLDGPSTGLVRDTLARCEADRAALRAFNARNPAMRGWLETTQGLGTKLSKAALESCEEAKSLARNRAEAVKRARDAQAGAERIRAQLEAEIAVIGVPTLPAGLGRDLPETTIRDIVRDAFFALLAILFLPLLWRVVAYYALAALAEKWPPMRFTQDGEVAATLPPAGESRVSLALALGECEEALIRQDYLQSSPLSSTKRTRWLLDWSHPLTSWLSGMRFLTAIRGTDPDANEEVLVSAVKDPLAELALLEIPQGAAAIVRPSALAGLMQREGQPVTITSRLRFSLPALLTFQFRYLVFHGPARLVLKGGRGVRIEAAQRGRIVGQGQLIGFSTNLAYSVIRSETFWPYFFGRESLLKDRVEDGRGVLLIEEAPLAGRSGVRRGFEGMLDAALKLFGV
jgi:hypothetical protein